MSLCSLRQNQRHVRYEARNRQSVQQVQVKFGPEWQSNVARPTAPQSTYMIDCETPPTANATSALWTRFRWM
jgi:hypothetical protein